MKTPETSHNITPELIRFDEADLDYSILNKHIQFLSQLAKVSNSGITIFDSFRQKHVFTSYNFTDMFGYDLEAIEMIGNDYFNERIHPNDFEALCQIMNEVVGSLYQNREMLATCKVINEYRIRNSKDEYVRIIEQHQALEFDKSGNVWLSLSVLDISPDQGTFPGVKSKLMNYKTGEYFSIQDLASPQPINLTRRELEVLKLVKNGMLSKEISEQLFISVHTVNTHRQKILDKLKVDNSMEAVKYASELGLLN